MPYGGPRGWSTSPPEPWPKSRAFRGRARGQSAIFDAENLWENHGKSEKSMVNHGKTQENTGLEWDPEIVLNDRYS